MATEQDLEKKANDDAAEEEADESESAAPEEEAKKDDALEIRATAESTPDDDAKAAADEAPNTPVQLGYQRYVYAAYMAGAMFVAFLAAKIGHLAWYRLGQWKAELGEPKDEIIYPIAAVVGVLVAIYYWKKPDTRQYTNEVAEELSKVTWPSRKEVTSSTTVVVITTVFATLFFALMDRFWGYITDQIYSF